MSCLLKCSCNDSENDVSFSEENQGNGDSLYQNLSEASHLSEVIPLLPAAADMIKYEADATKFELLSVIGRSSRRSTVVSLTKHIPSGHRIAVKRISLDAPGTDAAYIQQEILVTRQLKHENILPYLCAFVSSCEVWAVMPLMTYGSVRDILDTHYPGGLPENAVSLILRDTLSALEYVHQAGFIHRSVKAAHLLISSKGKVLLTGFRYSCNVIVDGRWQPSLHDFPPDSIDNLNWLSPEVLQQNLMGYNSKSDIYSVGITALELANGGVPYTGLTPTQILLAKLQGSKSTPHSSVSDGAPLSESNRDMYKASGEYSGQSNTFCEEFSVFTSLCLQKEPTLRPSAHQLLSQGFIKLCRKLMATLPAILAPISPRAEVLRNTSPELDESATGYVQDISWNF
ncbi:STE20-related kinase adapter protein alpha-like isoform X2 [Ornithodoros turicata]|uniref:STE20-related kinase adapter protein alpha-like isoform X2 n=1 Tax=Ornithodoros turicata TaxID=34597 RepID=UPI0031388E31